MSKTSNELITVQGLCNWHQGHFFLVRFGKSRRQNGDGGLGCAHQKIISHTRLQRPPESFFSCATNKNNRRFFVSFFQGPRWLYLGIARVSNYSIFILASWLDPTKVTKNVKPDLKVMRYFYMVVYFGNQLTTRLFFSREGTSNVPSLVFKRGTKNACEERVRDKLPFMVLPQLRLWRLRQKPAK